MMNDIWCTMIALPHLFSVTRLMPAVGAVRENFNEDAREQSLWGGRS